MENEIIKNISQSNISTSDLINAMKTNINNAVIIGKCCNRIRDLANDEMYRNEIGDNNGIQVILQAMRMHIDEALVQVNACAALQKLAFSDSKYVTPARIEAPYVVLTNTNNLRKNVNTYNHTNSMELQEEFECCSSPTEQLNFNVQNMKQIIYYSGLQDILNAMKYHPDHLPVQLYGICALVCFTFSSEYLRLLNDCDESKYLLEAAARRFPLMCRNDARNALDRLSELSA